MEGEISPGTRTRQEGQLSKKPWLVRNSDPNLIGLLMLAATYLISLGIYLLF